MITVAMPSLIEREAFREEALASIRAQTWGIPAVHVVMGKTPWDARNTVIQAATTEWIAFLDDDDWWLPYHLETLVKAADDADLVYSRCLEFQDGRTVTRGYPDHFDAAQLRQANFIPVTYLVRTELAREVGGFPPRDERPSDWLFLLRLLDARRGRLHRQRPVRFRFVDQVTWIMRHHDSNTWNWRDE